MAAKGFLNLEQKERLEILVLYRTDLTSLQD